MSMHNVECFIERAVAAMPRAPLDPRGKRDLIHALCRLQGYCDCSLPDRRCMRALVECAYTFLFDPCEMWDYAQNPARYEALESGDSHGQGDIYRYGGQGDCPEAENKVCVDSGSPDWACMVAAGRIAGPGAEPLRPVPLLEALRRTRELLEASGDLYDESCWSGFLDCFFLVDAREDIARDLSDGELLALTGIRREELDSLREYPPPPAARYELAGHPLEFKLVEQPWSDRSAEFVGYHAPAGSVQIWGRELHLSAFVMPEGMPDRVNPYAHGDEPVAWLERAAGRVNEAVALPQAARGRAGGAARAAARQRVRRLPAGRGGGVARAGN